MITAEQKENLRQHYSKIIIIPLDMDKMNKEIDQSVKENIDKALKSGSSLVKGLSYEPNEFFKVRGPLGVIKGTNILIDTEMCGDNNSEQKIDIFNEWRDENGKTKAFGIFAKFSSTTKIEELIKDYGMAEVDMPTFMADRFAYNSRIISNMHGIEEEIKGKRKKK